MFVPSDNSHCLSCTGSKMELTPSAAAFHCCCYWRHCCSDCHFFCYCLRHPPCCFLCFDYGWKERFWVSIVSGSCPKWVSWLRAYLRWQVYSLHCWHETHFFHAAVMKSIWSMAVSLNRFSHYFSHSHSCLLSCHFLREVTMICVSKHDVLPLTLSQSRLVICCCKKFLLASSCWHSEILRLMRMTLVIQWQLEVSTLIERNCQCLSLQTMHCWRIRLCC